VNSCRRLARLSPGVRHELPMVLRSPSPVRADLTRHMHERDATRSLADVHVVVVAKAALELGIPGSFTLDPAVGTG
jgi:hypothetical protein